MKAVQFEAGGPEKLSVEERPIPELQEKEVLIKVYATAINRADTLQRRGLYPPPPGVTDILGLEAAGVVDKLGPNTSGKWSVGDRVMALLPGGGNAEYVSACEDHLMPVAKEMSLVDAAAIPEVWLTAYQLLHFVGSFRPGDNVLIHAGGSGVGTAATQLVVLGKGTPFVTAGTQTKIDMAKSLGARAGFNYKEGSFSDKMLESSDGKGANVILDCVGSSFWEQNLDCLAMEGRWVQYGLLSGGKVNGEFLSKILRKRATLVGSTLRARTTQYKSDLISSFTDRALPGFSNGILHTIIDTKLTGLDKIGEAHRLMEANKNTGKIVIEVVSEKREEL